MDGLSAAASGMAVVSLAFQLGESIKQLHDFWDSIKEAPDDIHAIQEDLEILSSVLAEMADEVQHSGPDQTLTRALKICCDKVNKLTRITNEMEPGFASRSLRIRKWTAFKAVLKSEKIYRFQKALEGLKSTLILAQQTYHSRLNRTRYQDQQQGITTITNHLCGLKLEQLSATITTTAKSSTIHHEHTNAFRAETSRICRNIQNPVHRVGFKIGSEVAVGDLASNLTKDRSGPSQLLDDVESDQSTHSYRDEISRRAKRQTLTKTTSTIRESTSRTFFGSIVRTTRSRSLKSRLVEDDALDDEEYEYEQESSTRILPAQWLLKLGFNYAYNFSMHDSSTQGWQWGIKPINLVPDDAPIFELCEQGNFEKVRDLFSRNLASVRDVNSWGITPLHVAVKSHNPELCSFLIEAGADKDVRTLHGLSQLRMIYSGVFVRNRLANAIDTCRIFETSFDFWDGDGDGWNILGYSPNFHVHKRLITETEALPSFCSWFVKLSSSDIKDNFISEQISVAILGANEEFADFFELLLGLGPAGALHENYDRLQNCLPLFPHHIICQNWKIVNLLLAWGADPHLIDTDNSCILVAESPLSLAMYASWTFCAFRDALNSTGLDVKDFARKELEEGRPLLDAGWQIETLTALLELDFKPDTSPSDTEGHALLCNSCDQHLLSRNPNGYRIMVQPCWQSFLESIKAGTYTQRVCSDTQDKQPFNSQRNLAVFNDSITDTADDSASSHDPAPSEDQTAHPDQASSTDRTDISSIIFDRQEVWCIECWYHFKETGHKFSPASDSSASETVSSDEDDASEDDFSPYLIHT